MRRYLRILFVFNAMTMVVAACTTPPPPPTVQLHQSALTLPPSTAPATEAAAQPVWRATLGAAVNAQPLVAGERLVVATADGVIHAYAAEDGAALWTFAPEAPARDASLMADLERVCAGFAGGQITCLDAATGRPQWTTTLGMEVQSRPAFADDVLFVPTTRVGPGTENDFDGQASLFALHADTGAVVWETPTDSYILRRPTVLADAIGTDTLVFAGGGAPDATNPDTAATRVFAFEADTGAIRWTYASTDGVVKWLVVTEGVVVFVGRSETVRALDLSSGELLWSFGPGVWMQPPAVSGNRLFLGSGLELVHAIDAGDGNELWNMSLDLASLNQIGQPLLQDDWLLFNTVTGDIYALLATTGEQLLHQATGFDVRVGGAIYADRYIMGNAEGELRAFALP